MRRLAYALLLLFAFPAVALAADPKAYEEIRADNATLIDQVNQERTSPLAPKYGLGKVAYNRSLEQAIEKDQTGTSEFPHSTGAGSPIRTYLEDNGICYNWFGENVGFSNTLRTSPPAATADDIVDRWMASDDHRPLILANSGDWGGGNWVRSDSGTYFFAYYIVDVCGI